MIDALAGLGTPAGEPLAARVGIATGLVVVGELIGEGAAQEQAVVGETPNLAARLQALAEPGSCGDQPGDPPAGRRPVRAGRSRAAAAEGLRRAARGLAGRGRGRAEGRFEALHGRRLTPLVGREHELGILLERWALGQGGRRPGGAALGRAGHRQVAAGPRAARAPRRRAVHAAQPYCSPYHTNSALYPVIGLLERAARLERDDPPEAQLAKLEALLAAVERPAGRGRAPARRPARRPGRRALPGARR